MEWIEHRKGELGDCKSPQSTSTMCGIPKELFYDGWKTRKDDYEYTPLMYWIEYHKGQPIPDEFKYPGWQTDRCGYVGGKSTPLMLWINYR